jgi:membrane associated rhomboid family serine protease
MANCTRHSSVETYLSCTTCDRPFCYECLIPAAVGSKCNECAKGRAIGSTNTAKGRATVVASEFSANRLAALWTVIGVICAANALMLFGSGRGVGGIQSLHPVGYSLSVDSIKRDWWRLFTGAVAFQSVLLLAIGLGVTWWLGRFICPRLRSVRFIALCVASISAGALVSLLVSPNGGTFGGLSLSAGMLGAQFAGQRRGTLSKLQMPRMQSFGFGGLFILWFAFSSLVSGLDSIGAMLGGGLAGGVLGYVMLERTSALPGQKQAGESKHAVIAVVLGIACALLAYGLSLSQGSLKRAAVEDQTISNAIVQEGINQIEVRSSPVAVPTAPNSSGKQ